MTAARDCSGRVRDDDPDPQTPDTKPGRYYVTALDGGRVAWLLGPFDLHVDALGSVDDVRARCDVLTGGRSHWWAFGTARTPLDGTPFKHGRLNADMGHFV